MTKRFNRSRLGESIVAIELEMHKREDIEVAQHFIHEVKTKSCHVIDVNVCIPPQIKIPPPKKGNPVPTILLTQKISNIQEKINNK